MRLPNENFPLLEEPLVGCATLRLARSVKITILVAAPVDGGAGVVGWWQ